MTTSKGVVHPASAVVPLPLVARDDGGDRQTRTGLQDDCRHPPEAAPPQPHRLVANVDPALRQQILYIAQLQRVFDIYHYNEANHLPRRAEKRNGLGGLALDLRLIRPGHHCWARCATFV